MMLRAIDKMPRLPLTPAPRHAALTSFYAEITTLILVILQSHYAATLHITRFFMSDAAVDVDAIRCLH